MRCEGAQILVSAVMDDVDLLPAEVERHVQDCPACSDFRAGAWRIREAARFEPALGQDEAAAGERFSGRGAAMSPAKPPT